MKYPDLSKHKIIAIDLETKDQDLIELGPGYHRSVAGLSDDRILCVSVAGHNFKGSWPWNDVTRSWLLSGRHCSVIGANLMYDLGWLAVYGGVEFTGDYHDILIYESVLDGGRSWYSLDKLAKKYLGEGKQNDVIKEYCDSMGWKGDARKHIWRIWEERPGIVLDYANDDARQAYEIFKKIEPMLDDVCRLESRVMKPLLQMRKTGVRVDTARLEKTGADIQGRVKVLSKKADKIAGFPVNTAANADMKKAFDKLGLSYPTTEKGNPSFTADVLEGIEHPFTNTVSEIRKLNKLQSTYIEGFEKFLVKGRVYAEFNQVKNGNRGAVTGRFSAENPALQTIPSRGEGKMIARSLFLPEDGEQWEKQDQSQEEYRIFAHFARGGGAEQLRNDFTNVENFDMHQWTSDYTNIGNRSLAKTLNFGSMYGMGVHKFAVQIGEKVPPQWPDRSDYGDSNEYFQALSDHKEYMIRDFKAARLYYGYHDKLSCIKETSKSCQKACETRGYSRTLLKRKRFLSGRDAFKALNSTIQGTGGDIMKLWLADSFDAGCFSAVTPLLTVHDEIDFSVPATKEAEEAAAEIQRIGESCVTLRVPLKVDRERGPNWAEVADV